MLNDLKNLVTFIAATIGVGIAQIFNGYDLILEILLMFIFLDYLTGMLKALSTKTLASDVGWKGIAKKVGILIVVIVGCKLDLILETGSTIRTAVIMGYIAVEAISIVENLDMLGVPIPDVIKKYLAKLK